MPQNGQVLVSVDLNIPRTVTCSSNIISYLPVFGQRRKPFSQFYRVLETFHIGELKQYKTRKLLELIIAITFSPPTIRPTVGFVSEATCPNFVYCIVTVPY